MGIGFALKEYTDESFWWPAFIAIHLILMFYFAKVHKFIFRIQNYSGTTSLVLSLIGPGIGQAYNRQFIKGIIYFGLFIVFIFFVKAFPEYDNYYAWIFVGYYILIIFDAVNGTSKAARNAVVQKRTKEVQKKAKKLLEYQDHEFGVDTNILMHEPDLLVYMLEKDGLELYMSMMVFNELDGLKKSENVVTRTQAQTAFDVIEEFQRRSKLHILKTPKTDDIRKYGLGGSPDEKIIGTYLREREGKHPKLMFISNDKGARILARNAGMPIVEF